MYKKEEKMINKATIVLARVNRMFNEDGLNPDYKPRIRVYENGFICSMHIIGGGFVDESVVTYIQDDDGTEDNNAILKKLIVDKSFHSLDKINPELVATDVYDQYLINIEL